LRKWAKSPERHALRVWREYASIRRHKNMLKKLMDDGGDVVEGHRMKSFIADHYRNLF
jgi:hypothetical protein